MRKLGSEQERLIAVVRRVRSRIIANQALWEGALALAIALLGPALFFLLGADLFVWPLLILFGLGGAGFAAWRLWHHPPDLYQASQALDARLGTADQIATAIHFLKAEAPVAELQRRLSAQLVRDLNPKTVFPFAVPRSLYGAGAVLVAVISTFSLRYALEKPLNFREPLPRVILQSLAGSEALPPERNRSEREAASARSGDFRPPGTGDAEGGDQNQPGNLPGGMEAGDSIPPESAEQRQASNDEGNAGHGADDDVDYGSEYRDAMDPSSQDGAAASPEGMQKSDAAAGNKKPGERQGKDANGAPSAGRADSSPGSLMDRLKDAVNNLLSRLQQKPPAAGPSQASTPPSQQGERGENSGDQQQAGENGPEEPGGQQMVSTNSRSNDSRAAKNSSSEQGERSSEQSDSNGPGHAEGNKQIAESRRLKAMGKLGDLYGQRSAQVTGAIMVEGPGGRQNLQTQELNQTGRRPDAGGDVSRDEIPLAYQAYIKDYFSQLRRGSRDKSER